MPRSKAIDILRVVAVLLVMGRHMDRCPASVSPALHWLTDVWQLGGWVGVDLFFVLSGFLVSGLLFREHDRHGAISLKAFLIRRGFKIYPAFWVMLLTSVAVMEIFHGRYKFISVPCEFFFVQNYGAAFWNHTWSLAVEEHFYFFLALLLYALLRLRPGPRPFRSLPAVFLVLAATCLGLRLLTWHFSTAFVDKLNLYPTHLRMDSLFAGVLLSYYYHTQPERFLAFARRWRGVLFAAGLLALAPAFQSDIKTTPYNFTFGLTQFYLGGACLLTALLACRIPDNFFTRALAYLGSHSYSIYLWHMAWLEWIVPHLSGGDKATRSWPLYAASYLLGGLAVGVGLALLIEFPVLRLRDRWFPSRGRALETNDATTRPQA
ncbi:MAG: hypothetical protein RL380_872 [Verrucomicrobiota bacterium]|jgi:peptidoglycan/LPS O-acetylase OafA/YrhL